MDKDRSRHVVAVIRARKGTCAGTLKRVLDGLGTARLVERVALLTSNDSKDDASVAFGRANGLPVIGCSADDILAGFARAAEFLDADVVVRVDCDATVDGGLLDHLVTAILDLGCDHILPDESNAAAVKGIELFTRHALDKLLLDVADDPAARRHVTRYFALHPDFVTTARAQPYAAAAQSHKTSQDVAFVDAVRAGLEANAGQATLAGFLQLAEREIAPSRPTGPSGAARGAAAIIRVDGHGLGRAKRMIALARALRDREGMATVFAAGCGNELAAVIRQAGFEVRDPAGISSDAPADLMVIDCAPGVGVEADGARLTAVIADSSERRLAADYAYYSPLPEVANLDWTGARTVVRVGWEWALPGIVPSHNRPRSRSPRPVVLVSMGAGDPQGMTLGVARALAALDPVFRARFVIGPGFKRRQHLAKTIVGLSSNFETIEGADGLATEFASCDLALTTVGVTACELAAFGVPALYLSTDRLEAAAAGAFEHAGMGISLGVGAGDGAIAKTVWSLLNDGGRRREMRLIGQMTIDGNAPVRIAADLASALACESGSRRATR